MSIEQNSIEMDSSTIVREQGKEVLEAQTHIWDQIYSFRNSMALKCAIELGIPDAIQKHGKPITLSELANTLPYIHPNKVSSLYRLMRLLVQTKFFSHKKLPNLEETFELTLNSQLLLNDHPLSLSPYVIFGLDPIITNPSHYLSHWFRNELEESCFHIVHGTSIWEHALSSPKFNENFNQSMACDSRFIASFLVANNEFKGLFEGIKSLVDVGGGNGTLAKVIARAFNGLKCIVLDLPHVVDGLQGNDPNLVFIGGDMFEGIPSADAVLLKSILHDWSDDRCIKILEQCKQAIPSKNQGGKLIIIDIVAVSPNDVTVEEQHSNNNLKFSFDMEMMALTAGGKERTEEEWKQLFITAGFSGYKIFSILGLRSVIEVYH